MDKIVEMKDIKKSFAKVKAIKNGEFDLYPGEIHALIGENGAGKSTMMKILYGVYTPDSGEISIRGQKYDQLNTKQAIDLGIGMVHQEFMLIKEFTVLENIILGFEPKKSLNRIDFEESKKKIEVFTKQYGLDVDLNKKVENISVGEAQRVEIIKTLYRGANILILDEPTAVLTPQETTKLFDILRFLKKDGKSIIFISHKLNEIMEICDRITVMRHGEYINTVEKKDTNTTELAKMMVGREVFLNKKSSGTDKDVSKNKVIFSVKNLYASGEREHSKLRDVSFDIHEGEILGVAGVDGNGQTELAEAISGLRPVEKGQIILKGKNIQNIGPLNIRKSGVAHIPEDRNKRGANKEFTITMNLIADRYKEKPFCSGIVMNEAKIKEYSNKLIDEYNIMPKNGDIRVGNLSGGNCQKVICAREIDTDFDLLIAAQPTRGVDIGAIESIRSILRKVKDQGKSVLLISADLEEILSLSDRIAVMYEGKITGILNASEANQENVGVLMTGGKVHEKE